jgi:hypothetical protein
MSAYESRKYGWVTFYLAHAGMLNVSFLHCFHQRIARSLIHNVMPKNIFKPLSFLGIDQTSLFTML